MQAGAALEQASAAMVMLHGRGARASDILALSSELSRPEFSYLAPVAAGNTWYPFSFLEPTRRNEPWLSSALAAVDRVIRHVETTGIAAEKIILLGFSQGACLALEYAARNARRFGGLVGLSGGLIGTEDELHPHPGSLDETPIFLGCSQVDPHIPAVRVQQSAQILTQMGGDVTARLYPLLGHEVNQDEIDFVRKMMENLEDRYKNT